MELREWMSEMTGPEGSSCGWFLVNIFAFVRGGVMFRSRGEDGESVPLPTRWYTGSKQMSGLLRGLYPSSRLLLSLLIHQVSALMLGKQYFQAAIILEDKHDTKPKLHPCELAVNQAKGGQRRAGRSFWCSRVWRD